MIPVPYSYSAILLRTMFVQPLCLIKKFQRDIFNELVKTHVKSLNDFEWLKQSRFYYVEDGDQCQIRITDVTFEVRNYVFTVIIEKFGKG